MVLRGGSDAFIDEVSFMFKNERMQLAFNLQEYLRCLLDKYLCGTLNGVISQLIQICVSRRSAPCTTPS